MSISKRTIGCALEVHRILGTGFLESVYEQALIHELYRQGLKFERQICEVVTYKNVAVGTFRLDLLVENKLVVELKAVENLTPAHRAQIINYLRASGLGAGLLLNFGSKSLQVKRAVNGFGQDSNPKFV